MSYQRILVPIDFSEDSLYALHSAATEFAKPSNTLVLLHVVETSGADADAVQLMSRGRMQAVSREAISTEGTPTPDVAPARMDALKALAAPLTSNWKAIETLVSTGVPTENIIDTVKQQNIDLVIMGSHGKGGVAKILFGSTTYDVARRLRCAVLISKSL
jgi:nucleotide-binding universal stress UspA family protein